MRLNNILVIDTDEKLEDYRQNKFEQIDKYKVELKKLYKRKKELDGQYLTFLEKKAEYEHACSFEIGKGKYYEVLDSLLKITATITDLEESIIDSYTNEVNEKAKKEYQERMPELKKKKEEAEKKYKELKEYCKKIIEEYPTEVKKVKALKRELNEVKCKILNLKNKIDKSVSIISETESKYIKKGKVKIRMLKNNRVQN